MIMFMKERERLKYSGHDDDRGDMSGNNDDKRQYISHDDGDKRGDISLLLEDLDLGINRTANIPLVIV